MPKHYVILLILLFLIQSSDAQTSDSIKNIPRISVSGYLLFASKGISPIPAFSLTEPAVTTLLRIKKNRFSYEPEFALKKDASPWYFNNALRYNVAQRKKFSLRMGLILGMPFVKRYVILNGVGERMTLVQRYLWIEAMPKYQFSKKGFVALLYWNGHNLGSFGIKKVHYYSASLTFQRLSVSRNLYVSFSEQAFYLDADNNYGIFVSGIHRVGFKKFPVAFSNQVTCPLISDFTPPAKISYNLGLIWEF